jgi:thiamine kinase-like enzyme
MTARPWGEGGPALAYAGDVDAASRGEIERVLSGWDPGLFRGGEVEISVLVGGANNRNFIARTPEVKYALRIANRQNERFAVDRPSAIQAQRDAAAGGLAPEVIASKLPEGHVLSTFIEGITLLGAGQLRERDVLETVGAGLRRLHALPSSIRAYSPFDDIRLWSRLARGDGTEIPADLDELLGSVWQIESMIEGTGLPTVFCHNDTVPQNFILSGPRLRLVDWDYAGCGWACFELASFCATADLGPELQEVLLRSYDAETSEAQRATVELLRFVAAMREATWALMAAPILAGTTTPDADDSFYENYMKDYLRLARERAGASDFYALIKTAAGGGERRSW